MIKLNEAPCEYRDSNHTYISKENGKLWPGVTSIIGNLDKPYLKAWATKENYLHMIAHAKDVHEALANGDLAGYEAICTEAKNAYLKKAKDAASSGTIAHDWIDAYLGAKVDGISLYNEPIEDEKAREAVKQFLEWEKATGVEWLAGDTVVGSKIHEFGGKFDALAIIAGKKTLIDFKTSNQISKDYFIQTAAYQLALAEMGYMCEQRLILRIPKDGKEFEAMIVPTPLDLDISAFLALRQIQRWLSYVDNEGNGITEKGRIIIK